MNDPFKSFSQIDVVQLRESLEKLVGTFIGAPANEETLLTIQSTLYAYGKRGVDNKLIVWMEDQGESIPCYCDAKISVDNMALNMQFTIAEKEVYQYYTREELLTSRSEALRFLGKQYGIAERITLTFHTDSLE